MLMADALHIGITFIYEKNSFTVHNVTYRLLAPLSPLKSKLLVVLFDEMCVASKKQVYIIIV